MYLGARCTGRCFYGCFAHGNLLLMEHRFEMHVLHGIMAGRDVLLCALLNRMAFLQRMDGAGNSCLDMYENL